MKFIATNSDKLSQIPFQKGQLIFSSDNKTIYLDSTERVEYNTFIIIETEQERKNLISPVNGFYFIEDTKILWRHIDSQWFPLNEKPEQTVVFDEKPETGKKDTLYVIGNKIYKWEPTQNKYIIIGNNTNWEPIVI